MATSSSTAILTSSFIAVLAWLIVTIAILFWLIVMHRGENETREVKVKPKKNSVMKTERTWFTYIVLILMSKGKLLVLKMLKLIFSFSIPLIKKCKLIRSKQKSNWARKDLGPLKCFPFFFFFGFLLFKC